MVVISKIKHCISLLFWQLLSYRNKKVVEKLGHFAIFVPSQAGAHTYDDTAAHKSL